VWGDKKVVWNEAKPNQEARELRGEPGKPTYQGSIPQPVTRPPLAPSLGLPAWASKVPPSKLIPQCISSNPHKYLERRFFTNFPILQIRKPRLREVK
jgi:hypothetical protein